MPKHLAVANSGLLIAWVEPAGENVLAEPAESEDTEAWETDLGTPDCLLATQLYHVPLNILLLQGRTPEIQCSESLSNMFLS